MKVRISSPLLIWLNKLGTAHPRHSGLSPNNEFVAEKVAFAYIVADGSCNLTELLYF